MSTIGSKKANAALTVLIRLAETNPEVLLAKARYEQAQIDLERTVIKALSMARLQNVRCKLAVAVQIVRASVECGADTKYSR